MLTYVIVSGRQFQGSASVVIVLQRTRRGMEEKDENEEKMKYYLERLKLAR